MASFVRMGEEYSSTATAPAPVRQAEWAQKLPESIERGAEHLLSLQDEQGYWLGELEADTTLESDYIYYLFVLGKADPVRILKLANYVRQRQLPDGGWSIYPGGPSELNATCKAYFALKLAGDDQNAAHLVAARDRIHWLGGLEHSNVTRGTTLIGTSPCQCRAHGSVSHLPGTEYTAESEHQRKSSDYTLQ